MEEVRGARDRQKLYKNPTIYNFNCQCGKNFNLKKHFNSHRRNVHGDTSDSDSTIPKNQKTCPMCEFSAKFRDEMIKHFEVVHSVTFTQEKLTFLTENYFLTWKRKVEADTLSRFIVKEGTRMYKRHKTTNYDCHRSGYHAALGKGLRNLKVQGSVKINGFCPARISKQLNNDGSCNVTYFVTHIGHQNELKFLSLSSVEREDIARQMALKIPFDEILDNIRDSCDFTLQRVHLLTRQDLYNIEMSYNLQSKAIRHKEDAVSVEAWVKQMQSEGDCVLFYKPQCVCLEEFPQLKPEDFILIIMTAAQLEILKKYGNDCICLDGTHGLNSYDFELNTLLVLDELREGFPCAFLFSNRSDTQVLTLFFECIRSKLGEILSPKVFMSDLADTFFNAWSSVMGIPDKRLYCTWHVDRAWRKNLTKIKTRDSQVLIYKHLKTLLTERDVSAFHKMLEEFCKLKEPEYIDFIKYFKDYYVDKCEYWAYCYRLHTGLNTNMHLERMHRSIKYLYLKGKNVKRLDKAIAAIMRFIRDKLINRLIVNHKGKLCSKIKNIRSRHKTMEEMDQSKIILSDGGWEVIAESGIEIYQVQEQHTNCENCQLICTHCDICLHQFQCSCFDSSITYNMCKHIHLVAKSIKETQHPTNIELTEDTSDLVIHESNSHNCDSIIDELSKNRPPSSNLTKLKEELQTSFSQMLNSISTIEEYEVIKKALAPVNPTLLAMRNKAIPSFKETKTTSSNQNIIPQRQFFSTKKKGTKKKNSTRFSAHDLNQNAIQLSVGAHNIIPSINIVTENIPL